MERSYHTVIKLCLRSWHLFGDSDRNHREPVCIANVPVGFHTRPQIRVGSFTV